VTVIRAIHLSHFFKTGEIDLKSWDPEGLDLEDSNPKLIREG
jgi:hypothetical protein